MKQIEVIALRGHTPDGISRYNTGDTYRISETSARLLLAAGLVALAVPAAEPKESTEPRRYNRRDMRAEK